MKRILKVSFLLFIMIILTGCINKEKVLKCNSNSIKDTKTNYTIYYDGKIVNKVITTQKIKSSDENYLLKKEKEIKKLNEKNNKLYGGYKYSINKEKELLVIKTTINYKKMNLKKFVNDTPAMKAYVNKSNQLTINGLKNMYKLGGITCEK